MTDLSVDDQVSLQIGRAARQDVELELVLQRAYQELAGLPPGAATPDRFDPLWKKACHAVIGSRLPVELHDDARASLDIAKEAHDARSRSVHDLWRPEYPDATLYVAVPLQAAPPGVELTSRTVEEFAAVVDLLRVAQHRVGAIYWILAAMDLPGLGVHDLANRELLAGRFVLREDGSAEYEWPHGG